MSWGEKLTQYPGDYLANGDRLIRVPPSFLHARDAEPPLFFITVHPVLNNPEVQQDHV